MSFMELRLRTTLSDLVMETCDIENRFTLSEIPTFVAKQGKDRLIKHILFIYIITYSEEYHNAKILIIVCGRIIVTSK